VLLAVLGYRYYASRSAVRLATPYSHCHGSSPILVGTHHKTGTVLLTHILKGACKALKWRCTFNHRPTHCGSAAEAVAAGLHLCFLQHGIRFQLPLHRATANGSSHVPYRFIHSIRDPLEVVLSGYAYHLKTTERWAQRSEARWNGTTYVKYLNGLSLEQGLLAELVHAKRDSLKTMPRLFNRTASDRCTLTYRFEDFKSDWDGAIAKLWDMLGITDRATVEQLNRLAAKHNVYRPSRSFNKHVSSASADKRQHMRAVLQKSPAYAQIVEVRRVLGYPLVEAEGRS